MACLDRRLTRDRFDGYFSTGRAASRNASTRSAEARGRPGSRAASLIAINPDRVWPRAAAIAVRASQNSASRATLVRCPAREKLRLISPFNGQAPTLW